MKRMYKKGLSVFLVLFMVMSGLWGAVGPGERKAYAASSDFAGGTGTASDPYQIATADQLNAVRNHLEAGLYFKQIADIDLSNYGNWKPIALVDEYSSEYFNGNINGNGFKITNLKIDRKADNNGFSGLFAVLGGSITDMKLENVEVKGFAFVGGLVGYSYYGTISNSYATGNVNGYDQVGGLVGLNYNGTISNSYATGNVTGTSNVGGLVGYDGNRGGPINNIAAAIVGVTAPVTGAMPVSTLSASSEYTSTISWLPTTTAFAGGMSYTATITITPDAVHSLSGIPENFFTVAGAISTTNAAGSGVVTAVFPKTSVPITEEEIAGVTAPVAGATPVATLPDTAEYTAAIAWTPADAKFAGAASYTAKISLTPKPGYTLAGVAKDFFTVAGATTTNAANSGVVTAVFPATAAAPIQTAAIAGVTVPVTGEAPVAALADTAEYTATIAWNPADATFAGEVSYTAKISLTPKLGYTLAGVAKDFFKVAGAITTNAADSGEVTAVFPATAAAPIQTAAIAGVTVPVTGEAPVAALADTAEYTATIAWNPADATFAGEVSYTAKISLTPKLGYTLAGVAKDFFKVAGATTTNAAGSGEVTAVFPATAAAPIQTAAIAGVTVPVTGEAPVAALADTAEYTAAIAWTPSDAKFAGEAIYTAKISLTPKPGYTLAGVAKDFFTVAGATTTNAADSGVVTAEFPATAMVPVTDIPITSAGVDGVNVPIAGAVPVTAVTYSPEYTATVSWSPAMTVFAPETAYTATITITPKPGYTLIGVPANFFTVPGASTTNTADSGVVIADFPATATEPVTEEPVITVPITAARIAGVTVPVAGATAVTMATYSPEYTATVSWSPAAAVFAPGTAYAATIIITPKPGYTLIGVPANFFTVPGASASNVADSGVVTADFPATAPVSTDTNTGTGSTLTLPTSSIVTSTNGRITLPVNQAGEVSFENDVKILIPAGATNKELILSIEKVLEPQKLFPNNEILLSPVYEITKNFPEDFGKPITLTIAFDLTPVTSNQKATLFYFDEVKKAWVEVTGGRIEGNRMVAAVTQLGKYVVLGVDLTTGLPVTETVTDEATDMNLSDIAGHWAAADIEQALSMGMVKGYLDGTFRPNHTVTRAEFTVMLMNVLKPQGGGAELNFTDAATIGAWAQHAIAQAVQAGIITGYEDGGFRPNAGITRAEMAVILAKALGETTEDKTATGFADDKDIPAWAKASVNVVKQAGIVQGKGNNDFAPQGSATRAEAVTVLLKLLTHK